MRIPESTSSPSMHAQSRLHQNLRCTHYAWMRCATRSYQKPSTIGMLSSAFRPLDVCSRCFVVRAIHAPRLAQSTSPLLTLDLSISGYCASADLQCVANIGQISSPYMTRSRSQSASTLASSSLRGFQRHSPISRRARLGVTNSQSVFHVCTCP